MAPTDSEDSFMSDGDNTASTATTFEYDSEKEVEKDLSSMTAQHPVSDPNAASSTSTVETAAPRHAYSSMCDAGAISQATNDTIPVVTKPHDPQYHIARQSSVASTASSASYSRRSSMTTAASINGVPLVGQSKQDVASEVARRIREISMDSQYQSGHLAKPEPRKLSLKKRWRDSFYGGRKHDEHPGSMGIPGARGSIIISGPTLVAPATSSASQCARPINAVTTPTEPQRTHTAPASASPRKRHSSHHQEVAVPAVVEPPPRPVSAMSDMRRNASVKYGGRRISGPIQVNGTPDFQTVPLSQYTANAARVGSHSTTSLQLSSSHTPQVSSGGAPETIEMTSQASHFAPTRRKSAGSLLMTTAASANTTPAAEPSRSSSRAPVTALTTSHPPRLTKASHPSTLSLPEDGDLDKDVDINNLHLELERRKVLELKRIATNQNLEKIQLVRAAERDRLLFEETEKQLDLQRQEVTRLARELQEASEARTEVERLSKEVEKAQQDRQADKQSHLEAIDSLQKVVQVAAAEDARAQAAATAAAPKVTKAQLDNLVSEVAHLKLHRDSLRDALTSLRKSSDIEIRSYRDQCIRLEKRLSELESPQNSKNSSRPPVAEYSRLGLKRLSSSSALGKSSLFIRNELYQELFDRDADVVRKIHENIEEESGEREREEEEKVEVESVRTKEPERSRPRGVPRFITVEE